MTSVRLVPDLDLPGVRVAYRERDSARFDALGKQLGIELELDALIVYLEQFAARDRVGLVEVIATRIFEATTSPHGYSFEHIVRAGSRIYTCLVASSEGHVVIGVQPSFKRTPFPNPGWRFPRWYADPSRNAVAVAAWAREPARAVDAIAFPRVELVAPRDAGNGEALLAAVIANPQDDDARLVYADWLLERGDVRGELIRLQCELATGDLRDPRRAAIRARERELLRSLRAVMTGDLEQIVDSCVIRRGLVESVTLRATTLARHGDALLAAHPIRHARVLIDNARTFARLGAIGALARIPHLELSGRVSQTGKLCEVEPAALAGTRLFRTTQRLSFIDMHVASDGWRDFVGALDAPWLRTLGFEGASLGRSALELLARGALPALDAIAVGYSQEGLGDAADLVLELGTRPGLRSLALRGLPFDSTLIDRLAITLLARGSELMELAIARMRATDVMLEAIAERLETRRLDRLALEGNTTTIAGLAALLRAPGLANLGELVIDSYLSNAQDLDLMAEALLATPPSVRINWFWGKQLGPLRGPPVLERLDVVRVNSDDSIDLVEVGDPADLRAT